MRFELTENALRYLLNSSVVIFFIFVILRLLLFDIKFNHVAFHTARTQSLFSWLNVVVRTQTNEY